MEKGFLKYALLSGDVGVIVLAFGISFWLRSALSGLFPPEAPSSLTLYWPAVMLAAGVWILLFRSFQLDRSYVSAWESPLAVSQLLTAVVVLMASLFAGSYLAREAYSRLVLTLLPPVMVVLLCVNRLGYGALLRWLRTYGVGVRRVVIVGQSDLARELGERIRHRQELQYELLGFLYPTLSGNHGKAYGIGRGGAEEVARELASRKVDELIFTIPIRRDTAVLEFVARCQKQGIQVKLIPEYYNLHTNQILSSSIDGIPIFELKESSVDDFSLILKTLTDYLMAAILLIVLFPLMALIGVLLAVLWKGRVLKRESRVGLNGRPFVMYRFNMGPTETPQLADGKDWKTRVCHFLHLSSFSELPQLANVLRRDMSIVGPRPETPQRVRHYSAWHWRRLQVRPGITGLAQIQGLRELDSSDLKTKYDLEYVATFSPLLDFALILATPFTLLRRRRATGGGPDTNVHLRTRALAAGSRSTSSSMPLGEPPLHEDDPSAPARPPVPSALLRGGRAG